MSKGSWEVDKPVKCADKCSHIEQTDKHDITFSEDVWRVIRAMLVQKKDIEWQMMLTGTIDAEKGECYCTGYYVTHQEVTSATVTNKDVVTMEKIRELGIVCTIHSHVNMGVNPSQTDIDDSVLSQIDYHVIVNNKHDVNGMRKAKLPCGMATICKCDVLIEGTEDLEKVTIEGIERITKKTYAYNNTYYPPYTSPYKGNWEKGYKSDDHVSKAIQEACRIEAEEIALLAKAQEVA